jgi:hypothetical protein
MVCRVGEAVRRALTSPALLILLIAPYFGEGLSGSTPPLDLLLPWNLAFMSALYGCGALICREIVYRFKLGFVGLCLLGAAYSVWEEALVDRYWFYPTFWKESGIGTYSVVWHTNILLAVHLTAFHTAISICTSVLVVEWLAPRYRHRSWAGRPGLAVAAVALAATPIIYGEFDQRPPSPVLLAAAGLLVGLVVAAFAIGRRIHQPYALDRQASILQVSSRRLPRRGVGVVAFASVVGHWVATYGIAKTGVPWPPGVVIALAPIIIGALSIRRLAVTGPYGSDGVRTVTGLLVFFVLLDTIVGGLNGRYDLVVGAIITVCALYRLHKHQMKRAAVSEAHDANA